MTTGTISYHPFSSPVCYAFPMGASQPVPLLAKMALTAKLVAVIKVYLLSLRIRQKIAIILVMAFYAGQLIVPSSMVDFYITMGEQDTVSDLHHFIRMADAATEPGYGILAGKHSESTSLIGFLCLNRLDWQGVCGFDFRIVKRLISIMNAIHN